MNYERFRQLLYNGIQSLRIIHSNNLKDPRYDKIMRMATTELCQELGLAPDLKVREGLLLDASDNWSTEMKLGLKYVLKKDHSPVIDGFSTPYQRVLCKRKLIEIGYNPQYCKF